MRPYGVPKHRHLSEIEQELSILAGEAMMIQFTPHLVPVNRGILTTIYLDLTATEKPTIAVAFRARLRERAIRASARRTDRLPDTKNVVGTNFIDIAWRLDRAPRGSS